jgi:small subunit ribosomal protein S2
MPLPSEEDLLKAGCHIGHRNAKWCPKMKPFLYGSRKGVHIFDLGKTKKQLGKACAELSALRKSGKSILFVSTKLHSVRLIEEVGRELSQPIVVRKWIPGLLTNWKTISKRISYYQDLQNSFKTGEVEKYTKKEQLSLRKKLAKLDTALSGVAGMEGLPDAVFVVDAVRDRIAVQEARTVGVPVFGICDSNADPDFFTIPIPCNDDAQGSVKLVLDTVKEALGEEKAEKMKKKEVAEVG